MAIKEEEPKIKVLVHELLVSTLSYLKLTANFLLIHQSFKSLVTDSSRISLPLFPLPVCLITLLLIGASVEYVQSISNDVVQASPRLVPPLISRVCHSF
jgi:hypothetical protein